jgi:hypothetical protein
MTVADASGNSSQARMKQKIQTRRNSYGPTPGT